MYDFYAKTQKGLKYQKNSDCFFINSYVSQENTYKTSSKKNSFIFGVADGVGSSAYSSEASKYLFEQLAKYQNQITHPIILNIIKNTHSYLHKKYENQALSVFTVVHLQDNFITIYHVGDTRAYKLTAKGSFVRLTNDHSYVQKLIDEGVISEDMRYTHPQKNLILQSLGGSKDIHIDIYKNSFEAGERLLLTSDGIHDYIKDEETREILLSSTNVETTVKKLISTTKANHSKDDMTALLIKCS